MKTELKLQENNKTVTSLELCDQINTFRKSVDEDAKELEHKDLLKKIRLRMEAYKSVGNTEGNISPMFIIRELPNGGSKKIVSHYILPDTDATMLASSEVPAVSILVGKWIDSLKDKIVKLKKENKVLKKSINDTLIERLDNGERKIIKRFITDTIDASGYSGLRSAVSELNKTLTGKDYKEWLLKQLSTTFDVYINSMPVKEYKKISMDADKVELELNHLLKNFYSYSRGQMIRSKDKEYKRLRRAKDAVTDAYLDMKPKVYSGSFEIIDDEYIVDDDNIHFVVTPLTFESEEGTVEFRGGTVVVKDGNLYLGVNGAIDGDLFRTKSRDFSKAEYEANLILNYDDSTYQLRVYKLK